MQAPTQTAAQAPTLLCVRAPSGAAHQLALEGQTVTIGRDAACTIRVDSPYVSRHHARIEDRGGAAVVVDLGSRNGTSLNGKQVVGEAPLRVGDVVAIADVTIECLGEAPDYETQPLARGGATVDALRVDAAAHAVWRGAEQVERRLSAQEFQLLRYLYERAGRVCTREELGNAIWGEGKWEANMLHRLVRRLKEKIEPVPGEPRYVQTVPWVGYRLEP